MIYKKILLILLFCFLILGCTEKEEFQVLSSPVAPQMDDQLKSFGKVVDISIPKITFYSYKENRNKTTHIGMVNDGSLTHADVKLEGPFYGDKVKCDSYFSTNIKDSYVLKKEKTNIYGTEKEWNVSLIYINIKPNPELQKELCFYNLKVFAYSGNILKLNETLELTIDIE